MTTPFENFFTLPFLGEDTQGYVIIRWIPDFQLRHHINAILRQKPQLSEAALIDILLNNLRKNPQETVNTRHLVAFLSRFSVEAAWRVLNDLKTLNRLTSDSDAFFKDLFQTAFEAALKPAVFFKNFDFDRSRNAFWYLSVKKYIREKMDGILCDKIREIEGMETYKRTDLGLASRSSEKRVADSLKYAGETSPRLSQYILAWKCFQEVKRAGGINVSSPQSQHFQEIADRYNKLRLKLEIATADNFAVNGTKIEFWLKQIGAAVRNYIDRGNESLDTPRYQHEDVTSCGVDEIADASTLLERETLSIFEIQAELKKIKAFLYNLLENLDSEAQRIPLLMHGLELAQAQVGTEIGKNQSTVGRYYKKLLSQLLQQLGKWAKEHHHTDLNSETLNAMKAYLREQFDEYYPDLINIFFREALNTSQFPSHNLLRLYYVRTWNAPIIAEVLRISEEQATKMLVNAKQSLQLGVTRRIENRIQLPLKPAGSATKKLVALTDEWLKMAQYQIKA